MCGIVGYVGEKQAAPILLDGLAKLEYRGYDSAGIAVRDGEKEPKIVKAKGRLKILAEKTDDGNSVKRDLLRRFPQYSPKTMKWQAERTGEENTCAGRKALIQ